MLPCFLQQRPSFGRTNDVASVFSAVTAVVFRNDARYFHAPLRSLQANANALATAIRDAATTPLVEHVRGMPTSGVDGAGRSMTPTLPHATAYFSPEAS